MSPPRLLVHVEGQTEETFVKEVLAPHLVHMGFAAVAARIVGNARQRHRRGGIRGWDAVKRDILGHLKEDSDCLATTMVDYYALPQSGTGAWPARAHASRLEATGAERAEYVEIALLKDVVAAMGDAFNPRRFIPFVTAYEYEAILFSDCAAFANGIGRPELAAHFQAIRDAFATPEDINDSPQTAPSKRVEGLVAGYQKPVLGVLAVLEIGMQKVRDACPHFDRWIQALEQRIQRIS